jgi:hypothetical protein
MRALSIIVPACLLLAAGPLAAEKVYKWVDEDGVVHYGDALPPKAAGRGHKVLNDQGIAVEDVAAAKSAEQIAEEARLAEAAREAAKRDQVLLDTYLSVNEIEHLRDRRVELLEAQNRVTEKYMADLAQRLGQLQSEAARIQAGEQGAGAPPEIPDQLAAEIAHAERGLASYRREINARRQDQEEIRARFEADIARFRELKGLQPEA